MAVFVKYLVGINMLIKMESDFVVINKTFNRGSKETTGTFKYLELLKSLNILNKSIY